jgi:hypothetical protein
MSSSSIAIDQSPVSNAALAKLIIDSEQRKKTRSNHVKTSIEHILITMRERRNNQAIKFNVRRRDIHTVTITPLKKPLTSPTPQYKLDSSSRSFPLSKQQQPKPHQQCANTSSFPTPSATANTGSSPTVAPKFRAATAAVHSSPPQHQRNQTKGRKEGASSARMII